jgi:hypothetical protein
MQTFLPIASFELSAQVLDSKRLGKQRVEAMQLVNSISPGNGWSRHPASVMWRWNLNALKRYHDVMITEWVGRGFKNTMLLYNPRAYEMPIWFGDPLFHASHRSQLLAKDPVHYGQIGWDEQPGEIPYQWPRWGT